MQIEKSEGTWVEVIDWGEFKSFRKLFWIGRYRNPFWTGQFESFTFLGCVQTDATTPNLRCIVGRIQPIGLCKPCVISVRGPNNAGSVCMGLPTLLGPRTLITHGLQRLMGCIVPTMHCRSQHCWELLRPFALSVSSVDSSFGRSTGGKPISFWGLNDNFLPPCI